MVAKVLASRVASMAARKGCGAYALWSMVEAEALALGLKPRVGTWAGGLAVVPVLALKPYTSAPEVAPGSVLVYVLMPTLGAEELEVFKLAVWRPQARVLPSALTVWNELPNTGGTNGDMLELGWWAAQ